MACGGVGAPATAQFIHRVPMLGMFCTRRKSRQPMLFMVVSTPVVRPSATG